MNKTLIFAVAICAFLSVASAVYATLPGIPAPKWFHVSAAIQKPAKPGANGVVRFTFQPLIRKSFEVGVKIVLPEKFKCVGSSRVVLKASDMKNSYADFEFSAGSEAFGAGYFEFTTAFPADELVAMIRGKYGDSLPEIKAMIESIKKSGKEYSSSLAFNISVSESECALNPEAYFGYRDNSGFLHLTPSSGWRNASGTIADFDRRYAEALSLGRSEFKEFAAATNCDFAADLAEYLDAMLFGYMPVGKKADFAKPDVAGLFEKLSAYQEIKKNTIDIQRGPDPNVRAYITLFGLYNSAAVFEFNNADKKAAFAKITDLIKRAAALQKNDGTGAIRRIGAYLNLNAGIMAKMNGDITFRTYFAKARALNPNLFVPGE